MTVTIQSGIKNHSNSNLTNYALMMGGLNVTNDVLQNYDPLRTGYGRVFMVRKPQFLHNTISTQLNKFKHILEYGNTAIQGIGDIEVQFNSISGGYSGRSFEIPSFAQDNMNSFQVTVYEFSGSPVREVIHSWINGSTDLLSGLTHYNGDSLSKLQANQTAEFVYVATDNTGKEVEYCCFLANCFPRTIKNDQFNYTSGEHSLVEYQIDFTCTRYESTQINKLGKALLDKYQVLTNSLNFHSGLSSKLKDEEFKEKGYEFTTGKYVNRTETNNDKLESKDGSPIAITSIDV